MADLEGIILKKLLEAPDSALEYYKPLKPKFFSGEYSVLFGTLSRYFEAKNSLPCFTELELYTRDKSIINNIKALELLEVPEDISIDLAIEAVVNEYTQNEVLNELESFVDKITILSGSEIKREIASISLSIEQKTHSSEEIYLMNDLYTFNEEDRANRVPLGINNGFDKHTGGCIPSELILVGGFRGSGKSIVSTNIVSNQYTQGNVSVLFTIEMRALQVYHRFLSMLSGVKHSRIRKSEMQKEDFISLAKVRSEMFYKADDILHQFLEKKLDYNQFEQKLISTSELKRHNQFILVDNASLTLADIDLTLKNLKTQHGDKLKVVVVDYLNQINTKDLYDWKVQIEIAKRLKDLADRHDVVMVSPYQTDESGVAKFSKGILIPPDVAMTLKAEKDHIVFKTDKIRDSGYMEFSSPINWDTLCISPDDYIPTNEVVDESDETYKTSSKAEMF